MSDDTYQDGETQHPALLTARQKTTKAPKAPRAGRAHFLLKRFNALIANHGQRVLWQQSMRCGCRINSQTDQPNPFCAVCSGSGREYFDAREIRGVIENVTVDVDPMNDFGIWYRGVARCTVRPEYPIGFRDRVTMLDASVEFEELVERNTKTPGPIFRLRYRIVARIVTLEDLETSSLVPVVERIIRLRVWRSDNSTLLLREHADFDVLIDGTLDMSKSFANGNGPAVGDRFSVKYNMNPVWVVTGLEPQYYRTQRDKDLPKAEDLIAFPRSVMMGVDFVVNEGDED